MGMHNFRELRIWQRAMDFVEKVYKTTAAFPTEERYGLVSQLRSCAVSIPSNIAEGAGRASNKQFKYFLEIAMGSCNEVQTQIELGFRLKFITQEEYSHMVDEGTQIFKMILAFYNSLPDNL